MQVLVPIDSSQAGDLWTNIVCRHWQESYKDKDKVAVWSKVCVCARMHMYMCQHIPVDVGTATSRSFVHLDPSRQEAYFPGMYHATMLLLLLLLYDVSLYAVSALLACLVPL